MRISDWSSDVCSSDLRLHDVVQRDAGREEEHVAALLLHLDAAIGNHRRLPARERPRLADLRIFGDLHRHAAVTDRGRRNADIGADHDRTGARIDDDARDRIGRPHFDILHDRDQADALARSEEHTSELQSLMRISYDVFCLQKTTRYNISMD